VIIGGEHNIGDRLTCRRQSRVSYNAAEAILKLDLMYLRQAFDERNFVGGVGLKNETQPTGPQLGCLCDCWVFSYGRRRERGSLLKPQTMVYLFQSITLG
jgi:hypothetical protein